MENNNIPINKMISILVAIVVTACILVPLCNEFGKGSGTSSGDGSDTTAFANPVTPMRLIDLNDTSQAYTIHAKNSEIGKLALMWEADVFNWGKSYSGLIFTEDGVASDQGMINPIGGDVELSFKGEDWGISSESFDWTSLKSIMGAPIENIWTYDATSNETMVSITNDSDGTLNKIRIPTDYKDTDLNIIIVATSLTTGQVTIEDTHYDFNVGNMVSVKLDLSETGITPHISASPTVGSSLFINDWTIPYTFENGLLSLPNQFTISHDEQNGIDVEIQLIVVDGKLPEQVNVTSTPTDNPLPYENMTPDSGSDSGITGTLFQILPVFVLLAIIGSIAFMFVDRKEIQ